MRRFPVSVCRGVGVVSGVPLVAVALFLFSAGVASAKTGVAASRFSAPPSGFGLPVGVGVDGSGSSFKGHVYVGDLVDEVVDLFSASGVWESAVSVSGSGPYELSVDSNSGAGEGDVYVAGKNSGVVLRFTPGLAVESEAVKGLSEPTDAAVDAVGDIFVSEFAGNESQGKILEFNKAGEPITPNGTVSASDTVAEGLNAPQALAVNAGGTELYVATSGGGTLKYTLSGGAYTADSLPFDAAGSFGVSLGKAGDVFISRFSEIAQYEPNGTLVGTFASGVLVASFGIGTDSETDDVYAADAGSGTVFLLEPGPLPEEPTSEPAVLSGPQATLNGTLNGGGGEYYFAYNAGSSCQGGPTTPAGKAASGAVSAQVTGLLAFTQYTFCLVATNKYGSSAGAGVEFTTGSVPPTVQGGTASEVSATSALLSGTVNMNNTEGGCYFEYGTQSAFESGQQKKTPETSIAQGSSPVPVTAQITGLEPNIEYQIRLVAENKSKEITSGTMQAFDTLPPGSTTLPDDRVYEMVTPPGNQDADVYVPRSLFGESLSEGTPTQSLFQVGVDGSAIAYLGDPTTGGSGIGGRGRGDQYLASRAPTGGWVNSTIQPTAITGRTYYQAFSNDLSVGILNAGNYGEPETPTLSPGAPGEGYAVLYTHSNMDGVFQPLFAKPADRSPQEFGTSGVFNAGTGPKVPVFGGGSRDFSDLLFEANDDLLSGKGELEAELQKDVKTEIMAGESHSYLYSDASGHLSLVDVLPDGRVAANATFGAVPFVESDDNPPDFSGVISGDGSRVYWTALSGGGTEGQVFLREGGAVTVPVSAGVARYWASAEEGRFAFYTEAGGLYRFDAVTGTREALTASGADVAGVLGASKDGGYVYFAANGALASGANAQTCKRGNGVGKGGTLCNLYVWHNGEIKFIAVLAAVDGFEASPYMELRITGAEVGDWQPGLGQRTAEVGGGGDLVFMSDRSLGVVGFPHGYLNNGLDEVYTYDPGSGKLFCVSCSASGEVPPASEAGAAAFLPVSWDDTYHAQWMSEGGTRVFFDSAVPLVPQDTNGRQDVYEWEREGTDSCTPGSGANGGCVYLLSGGTSKEDSWFIGAGASGDDAFIVTRGQLVPQDRNEAFDLYDARVGGVEPVGEPACTGTGCQGVPAAAPTFATPPSVTFNGVGNFPSPAPVAKVKTKTKPLTRAQKLTRALKSCQKDRSRQKRATCDARAQKRYGPLVKRKAGKQ